MNLDMGQSGTFMDKVFKNPEDYCFRDGAELGYRKTLINDGHGGIKSKTVYVDRMYPQHFECPYVVFKAWNGTLRNHTVSNEGLFFPNPHSSNPKKESELDVILKTDFEPLIE